MNAPKDKARSLREIETEVEAEGREWMRRRLQEKLQSEVDRHGGVFPPEPTQGVAPAPKADASAQRLRRGRVGRLGKDPASGRWGCPIRQDWGLSPHQELSPALEDKLAYFATVTGSYECTASGLARAPFSLWLHAIAAPGQFGPAGSG